jgi:hypothetical protein
MCAGNSTGQNDADIAKFDERREIYAVEVKAGARLDVE